MKRKFLLLCAAYICVVAGLSIWQYIDYRSSFEVIVPYQHSWEMTTEEVSFETDTVKSTAPPPTEQKIIQSETELTDPTEIISYPLDLNMATVEELCTLPGIGEVIAQAICEYRELIGGFRNMLQLLEVYGIGEKRYQEILPYLFLEEEIPLTKPETLPPVVIAETEPETEPPSIPVLNLNTVTKVELMLLPGCTEQLAEAILHLRDVEIHIICNPLELLMVEGITDAMFNEWQPYLAVDDEGRTQLPVEIYE